MKQLLAKRNITTWLMVIQMKEMEANMTEKRRMLPPESPATSVGTFESEDKSLTYPIVEKRLLPSPVLQDNSGMFEGLEDCFQTFNT